MKISLRTAAIGVMVCLTAGFTPADEKALNPQVRKIIDEISEDHMKATIGRLAAFGTRNSMSNQDDPARGVGAARQWIFSEFSSYSPKLQVKFDKYRVKKTATPAGRVFKDVDLWNVIAVLPGTKSPEVEVIVSGHYDTVNLGTRPQGAPTGPAGADTAPTPGGGGAGAGGAGGGAPQQLSLEQQEKNANLDAPGACDDASGTSAVMELARVMSKYEFDKTIVFVAFAGEEQGLVGSTLLASRAKKENQIIEAVLNNDIIGTDISGNGRMSNTSVSVFSDDSADSLSQQLSRYIREVSERYIPAMKIENVFMGDRLGRGGDHTPFQLEGFAAVRFSTPNEDYAHQHRATDLPEHMSVPYTARVAKVNAAVAATLAMAPKAPIVTRAPGAGGGNGRGRGAAVPTTDAQPGATAPADGGRRGAAAQGGAGAAAGRGGRGPMIARGGGYDAVLQWRPNGNDDNIKGYAIVMRPTTEPFWKQEVYVGKVTTFTFKDVSIDDVKFGVKAIGNDGTESLVTPYVYPARQKAEYETVAQ